MVLSLLPLLITINITIATVVALWCQADVACMDSGAHERFFTTCYNSMLAFKENYLEIVVDVIFLTLQKVSG